MKTFLSSIFSFNTLDRRSIPRRWVVSILAVAVLFVGAEVVSRVLMAPLGDHVWAYWDPVAADKFEWYRGKADAERTPEVLVIGDSTGARNFDPAAFAAASGVPSAYNMAWPANFARALAVNTLPLLANGAPPRTVILMESVNAFIDLPEVERFERSIVGGVLGKRSRGELVAADVLHLARVYQARFQLIDHWARGKQLVRRPPLLGFMPHTRPADAKAPVPGAIREPDRPFSSDRRAVLLRLVELAKKRDFRLILTIGPYAWVPWPQAVAAHAAWLSEVAEANPEHVTFWDLRDTDAVTIDGFRDAQHLWDVDAARLSEWLGRRYAATELAQRHARAQGEAEAP